MPLNENIEGSKGLQSLLDLDVDMTVADSDDMVIKLRGLPWSCTVDDIIEFFNDVSVSRSGVHLITTTEGRSTGEAFVEMETGEYMDLALLKDHKTMGHRYIEVFKVKRAEMDWILRRARPNGNSNGSTSRASTSPAVSFDCFLRLRGLPFECSKEDVLQFFTGLDIVPNGIQLMVDGMGRSSGEAYVQFSSKDEAAKGLANDRQCIGHRYIEVFRVGAAELRSIDMLVSRRQSAGYNRAGPYDRPEKNFGGGPNARPGSQRQARFFKGFEDDSWNSYANEVGSASWNRSMNAAPPPPPPPGAKRSNPQNHARNMGADEQQHGVLMRGLPFRATEEDIRKFFDPVQPAEVYIIYDSSNRPSGTAKVQFYSDDDVNRAMAKHKERMQHRYIELFLA